VCVAALRRPNIPARFAAAVRGRPPGRTFDGPIGLGRPASASTGEAFRLPGCRRRPVSSPWWAVAASLADACASTSDPPTLRDPSSRGRKRVIRRRRPGRLSRPLRRRVVPASSSPARPSHRPGRGASPEVHVSLQRSLAVPRYPVWPTSGRSRCGVCDRPATRPADASRLTRRGRRPVRDAWRDGHPPLRFSACARRDDRCFPCRLGSGTGSNGSCTAAPSRPVFRYPREPSHGLAGVPRIAAPAALLGFSPFAALFPPAGVAAFPPLGPTCRFPGHLSRRFLRCDGLVGSCGRLPPDG
jgi:hypothetical protein